MFGFINTICDTYGSWHDGALDHTPDDDNQRYMYVVNIGNNRNLLFNYTINNLSIGVSYKFSPVATSIVRSAC